LGRGCDGAFLVAEDETDTGSHPYHSLLHRVGEGTQPQGGNITIVVFSDRGDGPIFAGLMVVGVVIQDHAGNGVEVLRLDLAVVHPGDENLIGRWHEALELMCGRKAGLLTSFADLVLVGAVSFNASGH